MEIPTREKSKLSKIDEILKVLKNEETVGIELYFGTTKVVRGWILKEKSQGNTKYALKGASDSIEADSLDEIWQKELHKWKWGSKAFNIMP